MHCGVINAHAAFSHHLFQIAQAEIEPLGADRRQHVRRLAPERRFRHGVGWCPEGRRLFPGLTVEETLDIAAPGYVVGHDRAPKRLGVGPGPATPPHKSTPGGGAEAG